MVVDDAARPQRSALTNVNGHLLGAWRKAAGDPDDQVETWLIEGGPAGIQFHILDPSIFPVCEKPADAEPLDMHRDSQHFRNYPGVEEQEITAQELQQHLDKGHIAAFDTEEELVAHVGEGHVLNKLGLIVKTRNGITKARMILDTKESGVKYITSQFQRVTLPRLFEAILALLVVASCATDAINVEAFVLDFSDAYWQIPINTDEQKYFCATGLIGGKRKYFTFLRAAQGSSAAGTLWARLAALVMRLTQSLFSPQMLRLMCYVDDPFAAIHGSDQERKLIVAIMVTVWSALGFKLAFAKGQINRSVTWIGGTLTVMPHGVHAEIKESIVTDILADIAWMLTVNLISKKNLHSLLGKLGHAAGLLIVIRPYLEPLWGALAAPGTSQMPHCIYTKQVAVELEFFQKCFKGEGLKVERFFTIDAFNRTGTVVEIGTDASPWGLGGWLLIDQQLHSYFASPITPEDVAKFGFQIGDNKGQQLFEALAILVAVRLWIRHWRQDRIVLKVRGDNVSALMQVVKLRPATPAHAIIARELGLVLVDLSFPPDAEHTPGVAHVLADRLSRVHAPEANGGPPVAGTIPESLHPAIANAICDTAPIRDNSWYHA